MKMSQRDKALNKYFEGIDEDIPCNTNLHESVRDAIHDAMKEHAIEFVDWITKEDYINLNDISWHKFSVSTTETEYTTEQLYNKFNLNK